MFRVRCDGNPSQVNAPLIPTCLVQFACP
jgi:hypothetical protein